MPARDAGQQDDEMTSSEDVLLKEVDEDLKQDQQLDFLKRYGPILGGVAALLVAGVGVNEVMKGQRDAAKADSAVAFVAAVSEPPENPVAAADAVTQVRPQLEKGYAALAALREGALRAAAEQPGDALATYREVYADETVPARLRDLARLRAGYLAVETDPGLASEIANAVTVEAYADHAQEIAALAALFSGDYEAAYPMLTALAAAESPGVASRAAALAPVADAGRSGVALEPETSEAGAFLESFTDQLGAEGLIPTQPDTPN